MNKQKIKKELKDLGIEVYTFEFTEEGHILQLRLTLDTFGWSDFEQTPIEGFEVTNPRMVNESTMRYTLVPANEVEFKYYIQKYINSYGLSRKTAMTELERIILNTGNMDILQKFNNFIK